MNAHAPDLDRLAAITKRYARYSRSAGGLSSVIGGVLCLATFAIGALAPLPPALRWSLAATPLAWLASKELLRRFYYQRGGAVVERIDPTHARWRRWMMVYLGAVAALVVGGLATRIGAAVLTWPALGYVAIVAALPLVAWRWFWSIADFLIGVLLICQSAVVLVGRNYTAGWIAIALAFSTIAIVGGWREHRDYLALRAELGRDA